MLRYLLIAAALAAGPAFADSIARQGADWVRLTLRPCADPAVVAVLQGRGHAADAFKAAHAHFQGQDFAACWRPTAGGAGLVYSDGDEGFIPLADIKSAPEA